MTQECLWYNGMGEYELLEFDPNELKSEKDIFEKAKKILIEKYSFNERDLEKAIETLYLIDINNLKPLRK